MKEGKKKFKSGGGEYLPQKVNFIIELKILEYIWIELQSGSERTVSDWTN
jgi:hypothetical protein